MQLDSLRDVLAEQLTDLRSAEQQLVAALPKVAAAAQSGELRQAFEQHLDETKGHLQRLEDLIPTLGIEASSERCEAMAGLIREGEKVVSATGDSTAKDAA